MTKQKKTQKPENRLLCNPQKVTLAMAKNPIKKETEFPNQLNLFASRETPDPFRKAVQVLHSKPKSPLSLVQRKLGNAWLKNAIDTSPDDKGWWTLGIKELAVTIGFDSNNRDYLKKSAQALMSIVFEWDVLAPAGKRVPWKASVLFPEVEILSDIIRYQISGQLRERMTNPDMYALIDMNVVRRFRRAASLAIWEFCIRFEKIGITAEVEWGTFRDMVLGESSDSKTYQEYKYFKGKVLQPAIAEINAESNHLIALSEIKNGRRIAKIQFSVAKKDNITLKDETASDDDLQLISELVKLGILQSEAKKYLKQYSLKNVSAALTYTRNRMADKKLKAIVNVAAYFRQALTQSFANDVEDNAPVKQDSGSSKNKNFDIQDVFRAHQIEEAENYFNELDAIDQGKIVEEYNVSQSLSSLRLTSKPTKVARSSFFNWLATRTWGEPTAEDLLQFAQKMLSKVN